MRAQGCLVRPLLEEEQPHRILAVDMDVVRDAAWLLAGTFDMLQAGAQDVIEAERWVGEETAVGRPLAFLGNGTPTRPNDPSQKGSVSLVHLLQNTETTDFP